MTTPPPGPLRALRDAWTLTGEDPVRILGWSALALGSDLALGVLLVRLLLQEGPLAWPALLVAWLVRTLTVALARTGILGHGALARGLPRPAWRRRIPRVFLVELTTAALTWGMGLALASPLLVGAAAVAAQGAPAAVLLLVLAGLVAWLGGLLPRAVLADAPLRAVHDGDSALHALSRATGHVLGRFPHAPSPRRWLAHVTLLATGDLLRLGGSCLFAIGSLPVYPLPLLALQARHLARSPA